MRIALINSPFLHVYGKINIGHHCSFPMGLGYIAAYVRQFGHQVRLFDPEAARQPIPAMLEELTRFKPDLIGISSVTANFQNAMELAVSAKQKLGCYVVLGGPHVSALPKSSLLAAREIDAVVCGEGEIPIREMADMFDQNGTVDFQQIRGVAFLKENEVVFTHRPELLDINDLPPPARDLVDLSWYTLHLHFQRGRKSATILSSRGCPSKCTFCGNIALGRRFRPLSATKFVDEVEDLYKNHQVRHFHIVDDCFTTNTGRVIEICDEIIRRNLKITWTNFGRVDNLQDLSLLQKMRKAGCEYILLGVESGNQRILDLMHKGITLDQVRRCCRLLRKAGIQYLNAFMIGNEGDDDQTIEETIRFAIELRAVQSVFNLLIPFPGTPIFYKYYRDFDRPGMDWSNFCAVGEDIPYEPRQTKLPRKALLGHASRAFLRYYLDFGQLARLFFFAGHPRVMFAYLLGGWGLLRQIFTWLRKST